MKVTGFTEPDKILEENMPYCSRCGVEVYEDAEECPLCQSPIQKFSSDPVSGRTFPEDEMASPHPPRMNKKERLHLASVLTGFGMLIPVLITLSVDLTINRILTWSYYPTIILAGCLLIVLTALYSTRKPGQLIWLVFLIICGTMLSLQTFTGASMAALTLGYPIVLSAAVSSHLVVLCSSRAKRKGSNVAAYILVGLALFCVLTDLLLSYSLNGRMMPGWSLIVVAATLPISLILIYLHYRKNKESKFKKYFHF
ncbi:DUF6320 domain-containing protein [Oceanispirochaeta sp.]|uniref:DUF6320 domain-containing protein n=1 Tax=Oceanispirochaeta sp. TaxID=2035350 RepID=UPI0026247255|nr:DUF6320 domain-containing protein [Oceanispirochaeta sp.]